jgi:hypothetical protein
MRPHAIPDKNLIVIAVVVLFFFFSNKETIFGAESLELFDGLGSLDGCGEGGSLASGVDSGSLRGCGGEGGGALNGDICGRDSGSSRG